MDSKPWGFYQPFLVPVYAFYVVFDFFLGGNKVTVNFKYWLKPYTLHMLRFASLMYTNVLILNQKKKKKEKKSSTLWSAFVSRFVCAGASGFTVVVRSFVVGFALFKMSRFGKKKKKEMHILWCFIVKGCVKRPARFRTLIFFFHSRVVVVFLSTHNQMEIQRARHVDRACWSFFQLRPFVKGSRNSGKHLWPVQVAHIRPLCCRCVGLLPPTEFHSAMQSVTLF